ncbi:hypothetical protein E2L06_00715 [Haloterrigena sp. H1]|uniref:DUF7551 domain-containing protein n=1 Tax=Haloterrigena sp. H1 TaxID=2552943 RepID=UPI00110D29AE|nr:hypothetical protein [Haloterrigena sp. H1]TMT85203.1 hypothetical protein E2L06_00715 [Haloterrigena sp. H1]
MVGTTLREIRRSIERLASDDGEYDVVCARFGEQPVPVAGQRFASRTEAADAARATEQYRAALRRYDPQLPFYDPIVRQTRADTEGHVDDGSRNTTADRERRRRQSAERMHAVATDSPLIGFCHDVSGAVFEALSSRDHERVERAIMDTYLAAAEATTDRNALCLVLLETIATELERHLAAAERTRLLWAAAANLSPVDPADDPVATSLAYLDSLSLIGTYGVTRESVETTDEDSWTVTLRRYAIDGRERRFPTLPIGIDILRRTAQPTASLGVREVTALGDGDWQFVVTSGERASGGLVCTRTHAEDR